ncbi:MAG: dual specificity protein phosphatase family protein [Spirochaeta sp.]|jgi:hypothetical protein|nr:dual specificity protein phosphatase family protein [Spirochaeta sp.]
MDAIPGRKKPGRPEGDFSTWLQEMRENKVATVVCLAPEEQIAADSPEYSVWRRQHLKERDGANPTAGGEQCDLIDLPVDDFHAPEPFIAGRFWNTARDIAERIENGDRVFIHCGAGIGRTGAFAVAVLMQQGYSYEDAYREINAVGSHPEVPAQREFLNRGPASEEE